MCTENLRLYVVYCNSSATGNTVWETQRGTFVPRSLEPLDLTNSDEQQ